MSYEAFLILEEATLAQRTIRYTISMARFFTAKRPSRLLTVCIQKYVKALGGVCNENVQGSLRKERGEWKFSYTGGKPGQEDLTVFLNGKAYAIELKVGKDVQSEAQKKYQNKLEKAGITYAIVKTFDDFLDIVR
jgi:hypothetical protein